MATNLTTIQVQLLANAQNFKKNIDTAGRSVNKLKKATAKASKSSAVCLDAPPVAFSNASNFNNCDSALAPAATNLPIATPTAVKPAKNISVKGFTLPMIAPIDDILPATGPSGPCTAAIAPDVLRKLS